MLVHCWESNHAQAKAFPSPTTKLRVLFRYPYTESRVEGDSGLYVGCFNSLGVIVAPVMMPKVFLIWYDTVCCKRDLLLPSLA
jgi:hypothetical protein